MTINLDDLEATAKDATPGPWRWDEDFGENGDTGLALTNDARAEVVGAYNWHCCSFRDDPTVEDNDAEHIAAFDPPTVLALIAKLREAEAVIEKELLRHREKHGETPRFAPDDYQHELEPTHWEPYVICDACGTFWPCKTTQTLVYKPTNQEGES
mgnify:CR=1 FL=1